MLKLDELKGVGPALVSACAEKGYRSVEDVAEAAVDELASVSGVGEIRAKELISSAKLLLDESQPDRAVSAQGTTGKVETQPCSAQTPSVAAAPEAAPPANESPKEDVSAEPAQAPDEAAPRGK